MACIGVGTYYHGSACIDPVFNGFTARYPRVVSRETKGSFAPPAQLAVTQGIITASDDATIYRPAKRPHSLGRIARTHHYTAQGTRERLRLRRPGRVPASNNSAKSDPLVFT